MKKLAIIRLSALGDIIISSSFLASLKALNAYEIHFFIDKRFDGILLDSPCVDKLHSFDFKKSFTSLKGILGLRHYLKDCGEFDIVIDM